MDDKLKTRIIIFYIGGILNALCGLYVVFEGPSILPADKVQLLSLVFLAFTVINFYMASMLKKKVQANIAAGQQPKNDDKSLSS
jgi:uncharacterized membrane protein